MAFTIPGGREKDAPIESASEAALNYWIAKKEEGISSDPNGRFAASNQEWVDAAKAELERRANGGAVKEQPAPPPASATPRTSQQRNGIQVVGEAVAAGAGLMAALQRLSDTCTLIAPTTATDSLPEGCAVAISMVRIDPVADGYVLVGDAKSPKPTDRIGLGKSALERIGAAAGADWIPGLTGRIDDARDPHYCHYQAWVRFQDIDGSSRTYPGECEIDLRDGSPQMLDILRKAEKNNRDAKNQLAEARKFIQRQCASKAMLVALRRPGLRHWYTREELQTKPFAVTKLIFHGRTDDPALKPVFANIIAERFGSAARQLFGSSRQIQRHAPPPVGTVPIVVPGETIPEDEY